MYKQEIKLINYLSQINIFMQTSYWPIVLRLQWLSHMHFLVIQ